LRGKLHRANERWATTAKLADSIGVAYNDLIVLKDKAIHELEVELAETKSSLAETKTLLDAAIKRTDSLRYQYNELFATFESFKVYLHLINIAILRFNLKSQNKLHSINSLMIIHIFTYLHIKLTSSIKV